MAQKTQEFWLEPPQLALLRGWTMDGVEETEVARRVGVSAATLRAWRRRYPELEAALSTGRESADYQVEQALFDLALKGNTTAMTFWLKNRRPGRWLERREGEDPAPPPPADAADLTLDEKRALLHDLAEALGDG